MHRISLILAGLSGHPLWPSNIQWSTLFYCVNLPKQSDKMLKLPPQRAVKTSVKASASWPPKTGPFGEIPSSEIIWKNGNGKDENSVFKR